MVGWDLDPEGTTASATCSNELADMEGLAACSCRGRLGNGGLSRSSPPLQLALESDFASMDSGSDAGAFFAGLRLRESLFRALLPITTDELVMPAVTKECAPEPTALLRSTCSTRSLPRSSSTCLIV